MSNSFFNILEILERGENPTRNPIFTQVDSRHFQLDPNKLKSKDREDPMAEYYCAMAFGINFRNVMKPIYDRPHLPVSYRIEATAYYSMTQLKNADEVKFLFNGSIRVYDQSELDQYEYSIKQIQNKIGNRIMIDRDFYVSDGPQDLNKIERCAQFDFVDLDTVTLAMDLERFLSQGRIL